MGDIINITRALPLTTPPIGVRSTNWVLTAAALAASVGSSLIGGESAAKAARKARVEQQKRTEGENAWYTKEYNTDYLDSKAGQNLMRRAQDTQDEYIRKADGAAAVGGASTASVAQSKEAANRAMGDTIANIAASDASRKNQVSDAHMGQQMQQSREREQTELTRAANITNAAQSASNALMTAAGSLEGGGKSVSDSKLGGGGTTGSNADVSTSGSSVVGNGGDALSNATGGASQSAVEREVGKVWDSPSFWEGLTK